MSKVIDTWTISLSQWRLSKQLNIPLLDITAKSGNRFFAPQFSTVMDYKAGIVSEEEYTELYINRMKLSLDKYPDQWKILLDKPKIALACYCRADIFCHRLLFAPIMKKYCETEGYIVTLNGEIKK